MKTPVFFLFIFWVLIQFSSCIPENITEFDYKALQPPSSSIPEPEISWFPEKQDELYTVRFGILGDLRYGVNHYKVELKQSGQEIYPELVEVHLKGEHAQLPFQEYTSESSGLFYVLPIDTSKTTIELDLSIRVSQEIHIKIDYSISIRDTLWHQPFTMNSISYSFCWEKPIPSLTGDNLLAFRLFELNNGVWIPVNSYSLTIYPYMDMGGGDGHSTPFTTPETTISGQKLGSINYVMSGGWELSATVGIQGNSRLVRFAPFYVYDP
jgi:hypothetical protein